MTSTCPKESKTDVLATLYRLLPLPFPRTAHLLRLRGPTLFSSDRQSRAEVSTSASYGPSSSATRAVSTPGAISHIAMAGGRPRLSRTSRPRRPRPSQHPRRRRRIPPRSKMRRHRSLARRTSSLRRWSWLRARWPSSSPASPPGRAGPGRVEELGRRGYCDRLGFTGMFALSPCCIDTRRFPWRLYRAVHLPISAE
jgi:hypothetical protein